MLREPVPHARNADRRAPGRSPCAVLAALGVLALGAPAQAAGSKEAEALKALKQALDEDYLQTRFDAAEQKLRGALRGCGKACSIGLRARLLPIGAQSPSNTASPCTKPSSDGVVEQRQQTLTVYKQNGLGFASLAFGVRFAPSVRVALHLAVRASVTFPVIAAVISPEGGLSVGF